MAKELSYYKKQNRILRFSIGLLLLALIGAAVYVCEGYFGKMRFGGQVKEPVAKDYIKKFRGGIFRKTSGFGVWYDSSAIRFYLDSIFPQLRDSQLVYMRDHKPTVDLEHYVWKIGFYWMRAEDPLDPKHRTKTDFCVVPILADTTKPWMVYDYFDDKTQLYDHGVIVHIGDRRWKPLKDDEEGSYAFNTGNMFP